MFKFGGWKMGVMYRHGKLLFYSENPGDAPAWAVDIREILAMIFVGVGALILLWKEQYGYAMTLLAGLLGYATGRTVPGGVKKYVEAAPSSPT